MQKSKIFEVVYKDIYLRISAEAYKCTAIYVFFTSSVFEFIQKNLNTQILTFSVVVKEHAVLLEKLRGEKGRVSTTINEKIQRVIRILKSVDRVPESSIIEVALLLYFSCIWDRLQEDKKTGLKLLIGDDEVFAIGEELKKDLLKKD